MMNLESAKGDEEGSSAGTDRRLSRSWIVRFATANLRVFFWTPIVTAQVQRYLEVAAVVVVNRDVPSEEKKDKRFWGSYRLSLI